MTELLQKAIAEVSKLPDKQQDTVAAIVLAEIESEAKWDESFSRSQEQLQAMADEALEEHGAGKTKPLNPDEL